MQLFGGRGVEWLHSGTIFKFLAIGVLGDMNLQSPQNSSMNVDKTLAIHCNLENCWGSQTPTRTPPILSKPPINAFVFETRKSIKAFSSYLSAKKTRANIGARHCPSAKNFFFTKHGPSPSQQVFGQSVFESCERKEKSSSVGWSVGYIHYSPCR